MAQHRVMRGPKIVVNWPSRLDKKSQFPKNSIDQGLITALVNVSKPKAGGRHCDIAATCQHETTDRRGGRSGLKKMLKLCFERVTRLIAQLPVQFLAICLVFHTIHL